jgi:hypothetical protein
MLLTESHLGSFVYDTCVVLVSIIPSISWPVGGNDGSGFVHPNIQLVARTTRRYAAEKQAKTIRFGQLGLKDYLVMGQKVLEGKVSQVAIKSAIRSLLPIWVACERMA